ncbi:hypothetical protein [Nesterenkonia suensis]
MSDETLRAILSELREHNQRERNRKQPMPVTNVYNNTGETELAFNANQLDKLADETKKAWDRAKRRQATRRGR